MEIKKIVEGMTAPQVAKVIEDNFNEADKEKADKKGLSELGTNVMGLLDRRELKDGFYDGNLQFNSASNFCAAKIDISEINEVIRIKANPIGSAIISVTDAKNNILHQVSDYWGNDYILIETSGTNAKWLYLSNYNESTPKESVRVEVTGYLYEPNLVSIRRLNNKAKELENGINGLESSNIFEESSNLVDFNKVTSYAYLDADGNPQPSQYVDWKVSDFIEVNKGDVISTNASKVSAYIAVYDANKSHIRNTEDKIYRYEDGDSYIRITFNGDKMSCHANYGETLLPYEPYYKKTVKDAIRENEDNITELYDKIDSVNSEIENSIIYEESSNLVDFDKVTSYAYLGEAGTLQSAVVETWRVSDFIAVTKGDIISANASKVSVYIAVYDANKNHVRNTAGKIYRYENGDSYIRITFDGGKTDCHANYGETLLLYEPYYKTTVKDAIRDKEDNTIELYKLTDNICKGIDLSGVYGFHQWGDKNLVGVFMNVQLTEQSNGDYMTTTYVPIAKGRYTLEYFSIGNCAVVIYDRFKDKILAWDNNEYKLDGFSTSGGTFNAPEGSCYIRICCYRNSSISLIPQVSTGNSEIFRVYKGKKLVTIGDSITQQKSWQKKLSVFQGFQWGSNETDFGVGVHYEDADGNRYAEYTEGLIEIKNAPMGLAGTGIRPVYVTEQPDISSPTWDAGKKGCSIYDRAKDAQFYNPDIIILWPCANDFSTVDIPELLGTIEDEPYIGEPVKVNYMAEPNGITIYSSLKGTLQILSSTCPNARIVVLGLMPWMIYSLDDYDRYMSMEKKMNNVIEECCKLYNIQYVDMFSIGCNFWNQQSYYTKTDNPNEGGHDTFDRQVHPNDGGCLKIAEYLSSFF